MQLVKIIKERRIPTKGEVYVKINQKLNPDTLIAKGSVPSQDTRELRINQILNIDPQDVKNHLVKHAGDTVEKGEVVAIARSFFRSQTKVARSPIDGRIESFSKNTGRMLIRGLPVSVEVFAFIPGIVTELFPEEGATIESEGYDYNGVFGVGGEAWGPLIIAVDSEDIPLTSNDVKSEYNGKIIVGGSLVTLDALREAVRQGVKGIIVGGVDQKDLTFFLGYEIGLGITGVEDVGLTLIITEGFGVNPMNPEDFAFFQQFLGKLVCINGTTHIRSRGVRPEIIIPI